MNMQMRTPSASEIKGRSRHHNDIPAPGTKIRALFDLFYPPLTVVSIYDMRLALGGGIRGYNKVNTGMRHLIDFYGLDIRKHHSKHYWLVGEYFPGGYLDYADESFERLGKQKP